MISRGDKTDGTNTKRTITTVVVDEAGSGYTVAPGLAIHNATLADPIPFVTATNPKVVEFQDELAVTCGPTTTGSGRPRVSQR